MFLAVVRFVAVFKRTMQAYWNWLSVADIFLRLARHWLAENRQKDSPKRHRAKRKTINCVNLKSLDMATLETSWLPKSLPKLWHPRFHSTVISVDKCGHQTWFIYEQLKQNPHIIVQKIALITKERQLNAVESTGNQNNQIKPCRFVFTVQQHGLSAEIFNTNDRTHPTL